MYDESGDIYICGNSAILGKSIRKLAMSRFHGVPKYSKLGLTETVIDPVKPRDLVECSWHTNEHWP